jgi:hypothetical protein
MTNKLEITEYYELLALHRALHVVRFARTELAPGLSGSPYLADIAKRVVAVLREMEVSRGKPEWADNWLSQIDPDGEVWQIAVSNAAQNPDRWNQRTHQEKLSHVWIYLSPFVYTDEMVEQFVKQVDAQTSTAG